MTMLLAPGSIVTFILARISRYFGGFFSVSKQVNRIIKVRYYADDIFVAIIKIIKPNVDILYLMSHMPENTTAIVVEYMAPCGSGEIKKIVGIEVDESRKQMFQTIPLFNLNEGSRNPLASLDVPHKKFWLGNPDVEDELNSFLPLRICAHGDLEHGIKNIWFHNSGHIREEDNINPITVGDKTDNAYYIPL